MKTKLSLILVLVLIGCGLANIAAHKAIRLDRHGILQSYASPKSQTNPDLLRILAGEFKGLVSDYLLLEVGSFLGSHQQANEQDWQNVYQALKQALILDPYFQQTYIYVQGSLPWQGKMPQKANELLAISRDHRPWDWFPGLYIGFNAYYFDNDYAKASEAFLEAAKIKGAPGLLAALGARFAVKGQRTRAAIAMLQSKLQHEKLDEYQRTTIEERLQALVGIFQLEQALQAYHTRHGAYPPNLDDLISEGIIARMPVNPYADSFYYDADNGEVRFDRLKTKTASGKDQ